MTTVSIKQFYRLTRRFYLVLLTALTIFVGLGQASLAYEIESPQIFPRESDLPPKLPALQTGECVGDGIYLYEDADYKGRCLKFIDDVLNLKGSDFNDKASSIRLEGSFENSYQVFLCEDYSYGGTCSAFYLDDSDLSNNTIGNDQASSLRIEKFTHPIVTISVIIERIRGRDNMEGLFGGDPDFYAVVNIGGEELPRTEVVDDKNDISPNWLISKTGFGDKIIPIRVAVYDQDGGLRSDDDHVDINPNEDEKDLNLTLDLFSCAVEGTANGSCDATITSTGGGDDYKADIWFRIESTMPNAHFSGHTYDGASDIDPPDRSQPIYNHLVVLEDVSVSPDKEIAHRYTAIDGSFDFDVRVPYDHDLRLRRADCINCAYYPTIVTGDGIVPKSITSSEVIFPGISGPILLETGSPPELLGEVYLYQSVDFFLSRPAPGGPASLNRAEPQEGHSQITVRDRPRFEEITPTPISLYGTNFHGWLEVYLYREPSCPTFPNQCERYRQEYTFDTNGHIIVKPNLPRTVPYGSRWFWAIADTFDSSSIEWTRGGSFTLSEPPYPEIYGFGFKNTKDYASLGDFDGTFGNNAYICLGAFGVCACRVRDPLYLLYYIAYKIYIDESNGSCAGMASTSLLFRHGLLTPEKFDPLVHYPVGFTETGQPASYDNPICGPQEPDNFWAVVRSNHGVQTSAQFISWYLIQWAEMSEGASSIAGNPKRRLAELEADPLGAVICMTKIGDGHCVTPYRVDTNQSRIFIYDNNYPRDTNRSIYIDTVNNRFEYGDRSGTGLYTIPYDVWLKPRRAPGFFPATGIVDKFLFVGIFGDADGLYTTPEGGRWGWEKDGTLVDALPGAVALSPVGQLSEATRQVPIALPMTVSAPKVRVNVKGEHYLFHAAEGGRMLQLETFDSVTDTTDTLAVGYEADRLTSFSFTPELSISHFIPKVGMVLGERERVVFQWLELSVPASGTVKFKALGDLPAVEYTNRSGSATQHFLSLSSVDGAAEVVANYIFGPFTVPDGATHRTWIEDWPDSTQLRSEIDLNSDGSVEETRVAPRWPCELQDSNEDDVPDVCAVPKIGQKLYLPLIVKQFTPKSISAVPDLVIENITATSNVVALTIKNIGAAPVTDAFWVDVYFDPSRVPGLNQPWPSIASSGVVWGIAQGQGVPLNLPINPGETRVLTLDKAYFGELGSSSPPYPVGVKVYARVDSVDFSTNHGAVFESNEDNNLFGPVLSITSAASTSELMGASESTSNSDLPSREK